MSQLYSYEHLSGVTITQPAYNSSTDHPTVTTTVDPYVIPPSYTAAINAMFLVVPPILFLIGLPGNALSIALVTRRSFRSSNMKPFIVALALADSSLLIFGLGRYYLQKVFDFEIRVTASWVCKGHTFLVYWLVHVSSWLVVGMTWQRTLVVLCPFNLILRQHMRRKFAFVYVVVAPLILAGLNSYFFWTHDIINTPGRLRCASLQSYMFLDHTLRWMDMSVACLMPFLLITVGNILIIRSVLGARSKRKRFIEAAHESRRPYGMTAVLLIISLSFLVTTLPLSIYFAFFQVFAPNPQATGLIRILGTVFTFLSYVNNCINFYLYIISGKRFRKELKAMFHSKRCCKQSPSDSASTAYSSIANTYVMTTVHA